MKKREKIGERVVKIDSELLRKVEELISRKENKYKYSSNKQFADIAILEKLERENEKEIGEVKKADKKELKESFLSKGVKPGMIWQEKKEEKRIPTGII